MADLLRHIGYTSVLQSKYQKGSKAISADMSQSKTIVLPTFSGKVKDYVMYWSRFEAYATLKGFESVLPVSTLNLPVDPNVLDNDPDKKKEQQNAIKLNNLAIACFTMLFTTGELMEFIEDANNLVNEGEEIDDDNSEDEEKETALSAVANVKCYCTFKQN